MFQNIIDLDIWFFTQINQIYTSPILDFLTVFWRDKYFWMPVYFFIALVLLVNFKRKGLVILAFIVITAFLCDQISASIIKPIVDRWRPCQNPNLADTIRLLVDCGSGRSFVSSHATNHFGISTIIGLFFKPYYANSLFWCYVWAAFVAYAQVYVGVHFPIDVICGAILGTIIGYSMFKLLNKTLKNKSIQELINR